MRLAVIVDRICVQSCVEISVTFENMDRRGDYGGRRNDVYSRGSRESYPSDGGSRRGPRRDDPDEQRRKMFCGGLSVETAKETVEGYFNRFGPLQEVIMVPE